jgi:hypothetical protein
MVWITHPDLPGSRQEVPESVLERVLGPRGWEEAPSPEELDRQVERARLDLQETTAEKVDDVLAAVGDDPVKAEAALDAERDGKGRKTLIAALERIVNPEQGD